MATLGDLFFRAALEDAGFQAQAQRSGTQAGTTIGQRLSSGISGGLKSAASGLLPGLGLGAGLAIFQSAGQVIHQVGEFMGESVDAAKQLQVANTLLDASLKQNIPDWNGNTDAIEKSIKAGEQLGFTSLEQRDALRLLVAQTKDENDALAAERVAMDLARLKGIDLGTAALVVGKAFDGNTTALKKYGIEVDKGTKGVEALAAIEKVAGGQADAFSHTAEGAAARQAAAWEALQEQVGQKLLPVFTAITEFTTDKLIPAMSEGVDITSAIAHVLGPVLSPIVDHLGIGLEALAAIVAARLVVGLVNTGRAAIEAVTGMLGLSDATGALTEATDVNTASVEANVAAGDVATATIEAAAIATDSATAAVGANTVAADANTVTVAGGTTVVEARTVATDAATVSTEANTVATDANAVANKGLASSLLGIAAAALVVVPVYDSLASSGQNASNQMEFGAKFGDNFDKVIKTVGDDSGKAKTVFDNLSEAAYRQGRSLTDVTAEYLRYIDAGTDAAQASADVVDGTRRAADELNSYDQAMLVTAQGQTEVAVPATEAQAQALDDLTTVLGHLPPAAQGALGGLNALNTESPDVFKGLIKAVDDADAVITQAGPFWAASLNDGSTVFAGSAQELAQKLPLAVKAAADAAAAKERAVPGLLAAALKQGEADVASAASALAGAATDKLTIKINIADTRKQITDLLGANAQAIAAAQRQFQETAQRLQIAETEEAKKPSPAHVLALEKAQDFYNKELAALKASGKQMTDEQKKQLETLEIQLAGYLLQADPKSKEAAGLLAKYLKSSDPATRDAARALLDSAQKEYESHLPRVQELVQKYGLALPDAIKQYETETAQRAADQAETAITELRNRQGRFAQAGIDDSSSFASGVGGPKARQEAHDSAIDVADAARGALDADWYTIGSLASQYWAAGFTSPGAIYAVSLYGGKIKNLMESELNFSGSPPYTHAREIGLNVILAWAAGGIGALDAVRRTAASVVGTLTRGLQLGGGLTPALGLAGAGIATSVSPRPLAGLSAALPVVEHTETHYHLHVDGKPKEVRSPAEAIAEMQKLSIFAPDRAVTGR